MTARTNSVVSGAILRGDCLALLRDMPDDSVDAIVTDPPYGLSREPDMAKVLRHWLAGDDYTHTSSGFMGRAWDSFVPGPAVWRECLRVVKPGGHLVAFSSTRTEHLLGVALALAGWERRDTGAWFYASGFPKSLDMSKEADRLAGAEREVVGRAADFARDGATRKTDGSHVLPGYSAGLADRWAAAVTAPATPGAIRLQGWGTALKPSIEPWLLCRKPIRESSIARQVLATGTGALNIDGCRFGYGDPAWPGPQEEEWATHHGTARGLMAGLAGTVGARGYAPGDARVETNPNGGRWPANLYACPKASRAERERGCEDLPARASAAIETHGEDTLALNSPRAGAGRTAERVRNHHPTVKPVRLMRWLCRLLTPPGGLVVDPFVGSGTTAVAAALEGFRVVGCELDDHYADIAEARLAHAMRWPASWADTAPGADKSAGDDEPEVLERAGQARLFGVAR